jgi:hypothetical protein
VLMSPTLFRKTTFFSPNLFFFKYQYPWFSGTDSGYLFCLVHIFIELFLLCSAANSERPCTLLFTQILFNVL